MALRLADSEVLPFNYTEYALALGEYTKHAEDMLTAQNATGKGRLTRLLPFLSNLTEHRCAHIS